MRVLFIGNSHTYANAMPFMVRQMLYERSGPGSGWVWSVTAGGKSLAWHGIEVGSQQAIRMHDWDFVVLQQQTHPFAGYAELAAGFSLLRPYIQATGAQVALYVTWKGKLASDADQVELDSAFARLAGECGGLLAPVGDAWRRVRLADPEIELYAPDDLHASPAGSYLAACTIFATLTGQSPLGLPARLVTAGQTLIQLDDTVAAALQSAAAQAVTDCRHGG